jgi:hypothetical protein
LLLSQPVVLANARNSQNGEADGLGERDGVHELLGVREGVREVVGDLVGDRELLGEVCPCAGAISPKRQDKSNRRKRTGQGRCIGSAIMVSWT